MGKVHVHDIDFEHRDIMREVCNVHYGLRNMLQVDCGLRDATPVRLERPVSRSELASDFSESIA